MKRGALGEVCQADEDCRSGLICEGSLCGVPVDPLAGLMVCGGPLPPLFEAPVIVVALPESAPVGESLALCVAPRGPRGQLLGEGARVDIFEQGCRDRTEPGLGRFDDQLDGACGRTRRAIGAGEASATALFTCDRPGTSTILGLAVGSIDVIGTVEITCTP